jgi:hypothetical protein
VCPAPVPCWLRRCARVDAIVVRARQFYDLPTLKKKAPPSGHSVARREPASGGIIAKL